MNVTREVIQDLLPLYLAGEASAASRSLVEEYMAQDPEFAEKVRKLAAAGLVPHHVSELRPDLELESLRRTRSLLTTLRWLFGLGIACTSFGLAMEFQIEHGRIVEFHFVMRDFPLVLGTLLVVGLGCLTAYFTLRRRLRLDAPRPPM